MSQITENRIQLSDTFADLRKENEDLRFRLQNIERIGAMITSILDVDTILSAMLEVSLEMMDGEVGGILIEEDEVLIPKISMGIDPQLAQSWEIKGKGALLDLLLERNEIIRIDNAPKDLEVHSEHINIESLIAAPVCTRGDTIGAMIIVNKNEADSFSQSDELNLEALVQFTAVAIENAKVFKITLENQQMEHELAVAQQVQEALLPSKLLKVAGLLIDAIYIPARQVGGDFYDIIVRDNSNLAVVVADVTNKGVSAALIMSAVRSMIRTEYRNGKSVEEIINSVNRLLCEDTQRAKDMFVTLFYGHIDLKKMKFRYISAGHPPSFLLRGNELFSLKTKGTILGQFPEFTFFGDTVEIKPADRIVLYTDGAFECFDADGKMLGLAGFRKLVEQHREKPLSLFIKNIGNYLKDFQVDKDKVDDTTILTVDIGK
ncbi:MAG: SpoIIE family protein phosphatase [candidate division Zixibacteria bacterium]|nr:SpoIIE family protein phosphatase [candidate division Zixibacteria bacterium]